MAAPLPGCDYAAVEKLNREALLPVLTQLVQTPFFRYFKTDLYCDCPFWPEDGMCSLRDCSVCECEDGEVPKPWLSAEAGDVTCKGERRISIRICPAAPPPKRQQANA